MTAPDSQREIAQLKAQVSLLARLVEVSVTLSSTLDLKQLLSYIIQAASEILQTEAASIMLYDEKLHELHFAAATGSNPEELAKIPVPLEGSIAGTIFNENRVVTINDVTNDARHYKGVSEKTKLSTRSLLGVPMRIKDRVTGVLEALNKTNGDFTEMDARILSILAAQAAVAIENARLVEALQKAYNDIGKMDKIKGDFIAIASHELRTPLGVILGYATFLREEAKEGEMGEYAKAVLDSAVHMRKLIEDLTNLRFLEVGQMSVHKDKIDLRDLLHEARKEIKPLADAKGQKILVEAGAEQLLVNIDRPKIMAALSNLLNNAVRFTPDGGSIEIISFPKGKEVWVRIKDNGIGIPKRDLENIFQGFFQVEDHMVRKTSGLGVGLSIVRGTVKLHNGRVWAESEGEGKGSTFTFTLPLAGQTAALTMGTGPLSS